MSSSNGTGAVQFPQPMSPVDEKAHDGSGSNSPHPHEAAVVPGLDYAHNEALPSPMGPIGKNTRLIFYIRIFIFFLIEVAFIALAAVCLAKPIVLNIFLSFSDSSVKGGFTVVFVVWQSCAIIAGGYILADAFSREWSAQLAKLEPGTTDRVSTVTSGFLDRTIHLFHRRASGSFKLAFFASLTFMALTQLAPGTISAATTLVDIPVQAQIGTLLEQVTDADAQQFLTTGTRANLIIRLEQIEHSPFGLKLQPNWLAATPMVDLDKLNGTLEYKTDVVSFHHDCHWEAPSFVNTTAGLLARAGGQFWSTTLVVGGNVAGSSISPLSLTSFPLMETTNTSAFLFIGGNSTFRNSRANPPTPFAIDLDTLPTDFVANGIGVQAGGETFVGPLASVLLCDPHLQITGGRVSLTADGNLSIIDSGRPVIGNFPPSAANLIFTNAFQVALIELENFETQNLVNNVASVMFMANSSVDWNTASNIPPAEIATINKNVDAFMLSAGKAFIDGYRKVGTSAAATFDLTTISATGKEQRLALTTSKGLFYTIIAVFALALGLLYALCRLVLKQQRYPFDLHSVLSVLQEDNGRRMSMLVPGQRGERAA